MLLLVAGLVAVIAVLIPAHAYAWGPITHIVHGSSVLANLEQLPAALQQLLDSQPQRYLYGCVGADIIQAKGYTRNLSKHAHSWPVAWRLLGKAQTDGERAFAWGYMSHLAADVISHNHFVPSSLLRSFGRRALGHAYWEARADGLQRERHWKCIRDVLSNDYQECDRLVESVVRDTLFSFKTNKRIFDSLMSVGKLERWKGLVERVNRRSSFEMTTQRIELYNQVCIASAMDLLARGEESFTQRQDATGQEVLRRAIRLRRQLRALKKGGHLTPELEAEMLEEMLPRLEELAAPHANSA